MDLKKFSKSYIKELNQALNSINQKNLYYASRFLEHGNTVFVMGNGGSASIAEHLCCDWTKGLQDDYSVPHIHSLVSNTSLLTAISNDENYNEVFVKQLKMYKRPFDSAIFISSSGNSKNIIKAAEYAKKRDMYTLGLTGFDGGQLAKLVDVNVHVKSNNYGIIEDSHQAIMHMLSQYKKKLLANNK